MNIDLFTVSHDSGTDLWHWVRLPSVSFTSARVSQESFSTIKKAVSAAKVIASCYNGVFGMDFDTGIGGVHSESRSQWIIQQLRNAESLGDLDAAIEAAFAYDLTLYHCLSRTLYVYFRRELAARIYEIKPKAEIVKLPVRVERGLLLAA